MCSLERGEYDTQKTSQEESKVSWSQKKEEVEKKRLGNWPLYIY